MKKVYYLLAGLIATMLLVLAGCGNTAKPTDQAQAETEVTKEAAETQADATAESDQKETDQKSDEIDYLALVNKLHALPDGWEEALETVHMTNSIGDDVEVETKAYDAYLKLKEDLEKDGIYVDLDSARRSVEEQQRIMDDFIEKYGKDYAAKTVAKPGYSEHHTGLALDLYLIIDGKDVTENEDMVQYPEIWEKIHEKLADYGFILRYLQGKEHITGYGYEPWHIRYIDNADLAKQIMNSGVTLEGYLGDVNETEVSVELGTSTLYSKEDLEEAVTQIKCDFASWAGCELHSLRYAGDDSNSERNLNWLNSLGDDTHYTRAAEFLGDFHSPKESSKWEADQEYKDYRWWLAKNADGDWEIVITLMEDDSSETEKTDKDASKEKDGFTISPTEGSMYCDADIGVNIRSGYSTEDAVIGVVHYGEKIPVTGIVKKDGQDYGWLQVDFNGQKAYVSAEFFTTKQPAGERIDSASASPAPSADEFEKLCREMVMEYAKEGSTIISSELRHDGIGDWLQGDYYYFGVREPDGGITYYYARTDWAMTQEQIDAMNAN